MTENNNNGWSRRQFLGTSLMGVAGMTFFPGFSNAKVAPSDKIILGFIGVGQQAMFLLNGFMQIPGVEVVAAADVYGVKRQRFEQRVNDFNAKAGKKTKKGSIKTYEKYQDLLARKDINAVVIATPDHWHALIAIDALKAGKDVYLEKPLTFTIKEGQELVKTVRSTKQILGVGSQQRSDPNFQHAVKMVQEGKIGNIERVNAYVGAPPKPYDLPEEKVPADLNWDLWLGPNPYLHYNHELNPPISVNPPENEKIWGAWRWYKELGGGFTTDWGAHMFDVVQWALNKDRSGPVQIIPAGYQDYDHLTYVYDNGIVMSERPWNQQKTKGVKFWGTNGWIEISRDFFKASDQSLLPKDSGKQTGPYETKIPHQINFVEAVRSRKDPVVPVEVGHSTCVVCTLGNIAYELGRPVKWDPKAEKFVNDAVADKHLHRDYRDGYKLPG